MPVSNSTVPSVAWFHTTVLLPQFVNDLFIDDTGVDYGAKWWQSEWADLD